MQFEAVSTFKKIPSQKRVHTNVPVFGAPSTELRCANEIASVLVTLHDNTLNVSLRFVVVEYNDNVQVALCECVLMSGVVLNNADCRAP